MSRYDPKADPFANPSDSLGYLTRIAFRSFSRALEKRTIGQGVSSGQWRFLRVLWREDGLTQRELSLRVGMREPTTVIALRGLEKSGLVERRPSTQDRRKVHVHLTPLARELQGRLAPAVAEVNALATVGMTSQEVLALKRLLAKVGENLAADAEGQGGGEA
jgi:DNA-binding MarR family transcriptional regulator